MSDYTPPTVPEALRAAYPWTGQTLEVDGGAMHYLDVGPRDGHVLLCLHGNPTWSFYWRKVIARFSDRYRVIAVDIPGFGDSAVPPEPYSFNSISQIIAAGLIVVEGKTIQVPDMQRLRDFQG